MAHEEKVKKLRDILENLPERTIDGSYIKLKGIQANWAGTHSHTIAADQPQRYWRCSREMT